MDDELISELLQALGLTLNIDNARAKLTTAGIHVQRVEEEQGVGDNSAALEGEHLTAMRRFADVLTHPARLEARRTREAASAARERVATGNRPYLCVVCETNSVDALNGIDTCAECLAKRKGTDQ